MKRSATKPKPKPKTYGCRLQCGKCTLCTEPELIRWGGPR